MTLAYSPEHEDLRSAVRKLFVEQADSEQLRCTLESDAPFDRDLWGTMAQELGLHGMALPEEYGGSGFGFLEQAVVLEEMGRAVHTSPYLASVVLAATLIRLSGNGEACAAYLPGIASGDLVATAAVLDTNGLWAGVQTGLALDSFGRVSGVAPFVIDGAAADLFLAVANDGSEPVLVAVKTAQDGAQATDHPTLDQTRGLATVTLTSAEATVVARGEAVAVAVAETEFHVLAALSAEMVGAAGKVLEATVDYAKIREQFGVPIGSFQAIKFKAADMLLDLEAARSASLYASRAVAEEAEDRGFAAEAAKAVCSDALFAIAAESVQIFGGIGFTWEHDAHLFFKRAKSSELLLGNGDVHRERLATRQGW
ncbi:MAG: acyl-CoA dehydrogenase family protein [Microthrixaceae bacterium]